MRTFRPPAGDGALALVLAVVGAAEVLGTHASAGRIAFAILLPLPLAWRRRAPVASAAAVLGVVAVDSLAGGDGLDLAVATAVVMIALYSLGAHAPLQESLAGLAAALALAWTSVYASGDAGGSDYAFAALLAGASWAVGRLSGRRLAAAAAARERAERAIADERARIARELHDVVAHTVGVMVVQAGAAEEVVDTNPRAAREALGQIRRTGKEALADLRRLLDVLREDEPGERAPQPGLGDLDALAERVRRAGVPVELAVEGEPRPVPPGVALTAYRVAQEALTNVLKHTEGARARVEMRWDDDALDVTVTDDGRPAGNGGGAGHGLVGMRERVGLYGGELEAAPLDGGGFRVSARLPLP